MTVQHVEGDPGAQMPPYDLEQWGRAQAYWAKKADARGTPAWLSDGVQRVGSGAAGAGRTVAKVVPAPVKKAAAGVGDTVLDYTLKPAADAALRLLELANDWAVELHDPAKVVTIARAAGLQVDDIADLRRVDLRDCDRLLTRHTLKWRTVGMVEGAAAGSLALVPVAGLPASIAADAILMDVLCTSIAVRVAYSYGFDAKDPLEHDFIATVVSTALAGNMAKTQPLKQTSMAHQAFKGRQKWSAKLREDHRLAHGLELLMQRWYRGGHVPVQHVGKALGVVAVAVGASTNSHTLAKVAEHSQRSCQTRWLCERYGLPLPAALAAHDPAAAGDHDGAGHETHEP